MVQIKYRQRIAYRKVQAMKQKAHELKMTGYARKLQVSVFYYI